MEDRRDFHARIINQFPPVAGKGFFLRQRAASPSGASGLENHARGMQQHILVAGQEVEIAGRGEIRPGKRWISERLRHGHRHPPVQPGKRLVVDTNLFADREIDAKDQFIPLQKRWH